MASLVKFEVDLGGIARSTNRFAAIANVPTSVAWTRSLRRLARYMQAITPPGNGKGNVEGAKGLDAADRDRGNKAIDRDLANLFFSVNRRNGVGGIQDPDAIHHRLFLAYKKPGKLLRRDRSTPYPVDMLKLARLARFLKARVGKTAAQWNPGFEVLGIRPAGWVPRQSAGAAKGSALRRDTLLSFEFQMTANSIPDQFAGEVDRRSRYAVKYTESSVVRETEAILAKAAGESLAA